MQSKQNQFQLCSSESKFQTSLCSSAAPELLLPQNTKERWRRQERRHEDTETPRETKKEKKKKLTSVQSISYMLIRASLLALRGETRATLGNLIQPSDIRHSNTLLHSPQHSSRAALSQKTLVGLQVFKESGGRGSISALWGSPLPLRALRVATSPSQQNRGKKGEKKRRTHMLGRRSAGGAGGATLRGEGRPRRQSSLASPTEENA